MARHRDPIHDQTHFLLDIISSRINAISLHPGEEDPPLLAEEEDILDIPLPLPPSSFHKLVLRTKQRLLVQDCFFVRGGPRHFDLI